MFDLLAQGFAGAKSALTGQATLTAANVDEAVRKVRTALLEADVHLDVVKAFVDEVKSRAIGEVVALKADGKKASPSDHFIRICYEQLVSLMGPSPTRPLTFRKPPTVIMLVGLQGVGKTTTAGKLAKYLQAQKRRPLLVGADLQRPAAQAQLATLAERIGIPVYAPALHDAAELVAGARAAAKKERCDTIVLDTAGRLSVDQALMDELVAMQGVSKPDEILLVVDAMAGQDSLHTARGFADRLPLTGFVMTKLDGDARGGAALSIKHLLRAPIKFLGTGEDLAKLEPFRAEGLASRILGMGDVVGLMNDFSSVVDEKKAEAEAKKMLRGQFTFDDFLTQLKMLEKMGSIKDLLGKLPMMGGLGKIDAAKVDNKTFVVMRSMIQSMTANERREPALIDAARQRRIARGSGRSVSDVEGLLQRFKAMQGMLKQFGQAGGGALLGKGGRGLLGKGMGPGAGMPRGAPGMGGFGAMGGGLGGLGGLGGKPAGPGAGDMGGLGGLGAPGADAGGGPTAGLDLRQLQGFAGQAGARATGGGGGGKDANKRKAERKAAKQARKRGRR